MITKNLFYYCKDLFIFTNIWMIGKSSMKQLYLKKKIFKVICKNMEDITDADYAHTKRACKDFKIKNLVEYHDLYVQSDTLLLADDFENFRNTCLEIYELDPAKNFSAPGLARQAALKNSKPKLDLLTDIHMLSLVQQGIRGGIYHTVYRYAKSNNKYMKYYDKNKESPYLQY